MELICLLWEEISVPVGYDTYLRLRMEFENPGGTAEGIHSFGYLEIEFID